MATQYKHHFAVSFIITAKASDEEFAQAKDLLPFREPAGSLLYATSISSPDLSLYLSSTLCRLISE
jgi:hypothetical protein